MNKIEGIVNKYDIPKPQKLVSEAIDKDHTLVSAKSVEIISSLPEKDQYYYLKHLLKVFKREKAIRAMTAPSTADVIAIKGKGNFKKEYDKLRDEQKIFSDEYWELKDVAKSMFKDLQGRVRSGSLKVKTSDNEGDGKNKPSNSNGRLTDECIEDLETHAKHNKDLKIDKFFKTAHKTYSSCTKMIIEKKDGSKVKEKRGWRTLMDEVKKIGRNDIYYRGREPRTNNK